MEKKIIYEFPDICVSCGNPARPGEMLCDACRKLAEEKSPQLDEQSRHMARHKFSLRKRPQDH